MLLEFIKNNENWKELLQESPYHLKIKEDGDYILFQYNQIKSDFSNPIVCESRGIILEKENYNVVCRPFEKFFNHGEMQAAEIDFVSARVQDKIDGSIIKLWYHNNECTSTNGTIDAYNAPSNNTTEEKDNFGRLFHLAAFNQNLIHSKLDKNNTYIFELVSPETKVVILYKDLAIYHIGTRNNVTDEELNIDIGIKKPKEFKCNSITDMVKMSKELPYDKEGYVIVDKNWNRIKIKSPGYVAMHHLKASYNIDKLLTIVRENEGDEFLIYFPEYKKDYDILKNKYLDLITLLELHYTIMQNFKFKNKKEFAINFAKNTIIPSIFFNIYDGKCKSILEALNKTKNEIILKVIDQMEKIIYRFKGNGVVWYSRRNKILIQTK